MRRLVSLGKFLIFVLAVLAVSNVIFGTIAAVQGKWACAAKLFVWMAIDLAVIWMAKVMIIDDYRKNKDLYRDMEGRR